MNEIIPFHFEERSVRIIMRNDAPWFVAADVAKILEIGRTDDAVRRLDEDEKGADIIRTPGGAQSATIISESGLYALIMTSRKPEAAFESGALQKRHPFCYGPGRGRFAFADCNL